MSPAFAQLANVKVNKLIDQHTLQLGTVGSRSFVKYRARCDLNVQGNSYPMYLGIANFDCYDMILGVSFIQKHKMTLDFEWDCVIIDGASVPAQDIVEGADAVPGPDKAEEVDRGEGKATSNGNVEKRHRHASALQFIEAPSDLVPRVYEGGLKTWECSLDLVEYLDSTYGEGAEGFHGRSVLELGCGTAVPSLYILHHIFSSPLPSDGTPLPETVIYLQDYNESVLELVTLPNILLTWYLSPASHLYRTSNTDEDLPFPIPPEPFDLPLSDSLKTSFLQSLTEIYNISLRFFSGSWASFASSQLSNIPSTTKTFDLVLTSETIYRMESLPSLVDIMRLACIGPDANSKQAQKEGKCLVAAKVLYFGVGGGVSDFIDFVDKAAVAKVKTVRERKTGVGRVILSLDFL
ncbi:Histidine protein methyltransferase 1 [Leucoagaricus sp. SymC.cos]|nr:Histidine protein methyltransferase 1 [Leucoagaricus sp. SymC.cos]